MQTDKKYNNCNPEIWGGIECTINRVGNEYSDQLQIADCYSRDHDIDLIAGLGISKMRFPILWERHQPFPDEPIDFSWTEKQLSKLTSYGITPIAGLLHHGSGPAFTNLLDLNFAPMLARYAEQVAKKFPSIEYYTPVNEPLTTARFSGLYGFWYPHKRNDISFVKMFLNQMKGVVMSMIAIRKINPAAKLVQTEDLGKTYSTPSLAYQAKFENERRWLTYDLLCGKIKPGNRMWAYFNRLGISPESLNYFVENPCPPDIMGFNYYVTSERFLDDELSKYEPSTHGGNEVHQYADVEAIRVLHGHNSGLKILLQEAWERYHLPMAITEVQINSTVDQQMKWLQGIYNVCAALRAEGVDLRAVTPWALFGAYGWNNLLTTEEKDYEIGAFDLRFGDPERTELANFISSLASDANHPHDFLIGKGWWEEDHRYLHKKENEHSKDHTPSA